MRFHFCDENYLCCFQHKLPSWVSVVDMTMPQTDVQGIRIQFPAGEADVYLTQASWLAMTPSQPPLVNGYWVKRVWSSPLNPIHCQGEKWVELYLHFPTCLHSMDGINLTCTVPSHHTFQTKLYSSIAGFSCYHQGLDFGFHFTNRNLSNIPQTCRMGLQGQTQRNSFYAYISQTFYLPAYFGNHHVHYSDYQYLSLSLNMVMIT